MGVNLQNVDLTPDDVQIIKMLLYRKAMENYDKTHKFGVEGKIFDKLYPITKEKLIGW